MSKKFEVLITMGLHNSGTEIVSEYEAEYLKSAIRTTMTDQLGFFEFENGRYVNLANVHTITITEIKDDK